MAGKLKLRAVSVIAVLIALVLGGCASPAERTRSLLVQYAAADRAYDQNDCSTAIALYRELADKMNDDTESLLRIGNCHARSHNWTAAILAYQTALQRDKSFVKAWYNLSYVQARILRETVAEMLQHVDPADPVAERARRLAAEVLEPYELSVEAPGPTPNLLPDSETDAVDDAD